VISGQWPVTAYQQIWHDHHAGKGLNCPSLTGH
jgi:hypothetical protein